MDLKNVQFLIGANPQKFAKRGKRSKIHKGMRKKSRRSRRKTRNPQIYSFTTTKKLPTGGTETIIRKEKFATGRDVRAHDRRYNKALGNFTKRLHEKDYSEAVHNKMKEWSAKKVRDIAALRGKVTKQKQEFASMRKAGTKIKKVGKYIPAYPVSKRSKSMARKRKGKKSSRRRSRKVRAATRAKASVRKQLSKVVRSRKAKRLKMIFPKRGSKVAARVKRGKKRYSIIAKRNPLMGSDALGSALMNPRKRRKHGPRRHRRNPVAALMSGQMASGRDWADMITAHEIPELSGMFVGGVLLAPFKGGVHTLAAMKIPVLSTILVGYQSIVSKYRPLENILPLLVGAGVAHLGKRYNMRSVEIVGKGFAAASVVMAGIEVAQTLPVIKDLALTAAPAIPGKMPVVLPTPAKLSGLLSGDEGFEGRPDTGFMGADELVSPSQSQLGWEETGYMGDEGFEGADQLVSTSESQMG